jgi:hypothetical protein
MYSKHNTIDEAILEIENLTNKKVKIIKYTNYGFKTIM